MAISVDLLDMCLTDTHTYTYCMCVYIYIVISKIATDLVGISIVRWVNIDQGA